MFVVFYQEEEKMKASKQLYHEHKIITLILTSPI